MNTAKELFLKNKELREKWAAVAHADWFGEVLVFARSVCMDNKPTAEKIMGMLEFESALLSICDEQVVSVEYPSSGIRHDIDRTSKKQDSKDT